MAGRDRLDRRPDPTSRSVASPRPRSRRKDWPKGCHVLPDPRTENDRSDPRIRQARGRPDGRGSETAETLDESATSAPLESETEPESSRRNPRPPEPIRPRIDDDGPGPARRTPATRAVRSGLHDDRLQSTDRGRSRDLRRTPFAPKANAHSRPERIATHAPLRPAAVSEPVLQRYQAITARQRQMTLRRPPPREPDHLPSRRRDQ